MKRLTKTILKLLSSSFAFTLCVNALYSQITNTNLATSYIKDGREGMYPSIIVFNPQNQPSFVQNEIKTINEQQSILNIKNAVYVNSINSAGNNMMHYRYQQTYNGIPIENAITAIHTKNNKIVSTNGDLIKDFPKNLPEKPSIAFTKAIEKSLQYVPAQVYAWQSDYVESLIKQREKNPKASFYPKMEIVYYSGEDKVVPEALKLAYKIHIFSIQPMQDKYIFIDATNGNILGVRELISRADQDGIAQTAYSGKQKINTKIKYSGNKTFWTLEESDNRHVNIRTLNFKNQVSLANATTFNDDDNNWNNVNADLDQYATDAHWGAEMTFDFFKKNFQRNSLDNQGFPMTTYFHTDFVKFFNDPNNNDAAWVPSIGAVFCGDGDRKTFSPLTDIQTIAHEFAHGITQFTSALQSGQYESGALNEGFSDIFGVCVEMNSPKINPTWVHSKEYTSDTYYWRDLSDPKKYNFPACYKGKYWDGSSEPHRNSTVLSHWFYLLANGGNVTNDWGNDFQLKSIGLFDAEVIAYFTNTAYLTSTSNYNDAMQLSIQCAEEYFGKASAQADAVKQAWKALGLSSDPDILSFPPQKICPGSPITVDYSSSITFNKGNIFTLFLSDANGDFKNEKVIGWLASTKNNFSISGMVSSSTPSSLNYRVRVKSSDPEMLNTQGSHFQLYIYPNPLPTITSSEASLCTWQEAVLTASSTTNVSSWLWNSGETTKSITVKSYGTHSVSVKYINGCQSPYAEIKIPKSANCNIGIYRWWSSEQDQNNNTAIASSTAAIQVYPNPLKSEAILKARLTKEEILNIKGNAIISLYEASGKKIAIFNMNKNNNILEGKIKKANLSAGNYYFAVSVNQQVLRRGKVTIE